MNRKEYIKSHHEQAMAFITVCMTPEERKKIEEAAKKLGITLSVYIKSKLFYE